MYDGGGSLWDQGWVKNKFCYVRGRKEGISEELWGQLESERVGVRGRIDEYLGGVKKEVEGFESLGRGIDDIVFDCGKRIGLHFDKKKHHATPEQVEPLNKPAEEHFEAKSKFF